jgi:glycosyltransferase involved in cell wall biosynthesis
MKNGILSVLMVCYNHALHIREAIESVIQQTYKDWELIIVDDGSNDGSVFIINEYLQSFPEQIKLFTHHGNKNLGIAASYSLGLQYCKGEFIGFLEPDDVWEENNAQIKVDALERCQVSLVYSYVRPIGESDSIIKKRFILRLIDSVPSNVLFNGLPRLLFYNFIPSFSAVFVKKEMLIHIKFLLEQEFPVWLDWFFWFQISRKTRFLYLPQYLVKWRLYKRSYCSKFQNEGMKSYLIASKIRFRLRLFGEVLSFRYCKEVHSSK